MKFLFAMFLVSASLTAVANENFECEFLGPNYYLSFQDNGSITLSNAFKTFECKKGVVNFPGTVVELSVLNCANSFEKVTYYAAENGHGDIVLSKGLVLSKDILCHKI